MLFVDYLKPSLGESFYSRILQRLSLSDNSQRSAGIALLWWIKVMGLWLLLAWIKFDPWSARS